MSTFPLHPHPKRLHTGSCDFTQDRFYATTLAFTGSRLQLTGIRLVTYTCSSHQSGPGPMRDALGN